MPLSSPAATKSDELVRLAGEISRLKGRVVVVGLVGMNLPRDIYYKKELDVRLSMSYGPGRYDVEYEERGHDYPLAYVRWTEQRNMEAFLDLVSSQRVDVLSLISHRFPFERALEAYRLITEGKESTLGVVLQYAPSPEPEKIIVNSKKTLPSSGVIGVGFIGTGNFARSVLLPPLSKLENVSLRGVASGRGMSAKAAAQEFGFEYCSDSHEALIQDESIHAIFVATRHDLHGPLVRQILMAGKHVFVEKPLCINPEELQHIQLCVSDRKKGGNTPIAMVGFNRRFSELVRRMKESLSGRRTPLIASYRINAGFVPKESWVQDPIQGAGRIIGEVCHFVDTLRFLVGAPVRLVQAACVRSDQADHVDRDSVSINLSYEDGSVGNILYYALGNPAYPKEKLECAADGCTVLLDDYRRIEILSGRNKDKKSGKQDKGHAQEIRSFIEAVSSGGPEPIPFQELAETTMVTFAVHRALNTGETVLID